MKYKTKEEWAKLLKPIFIENPRISLSKISIKLNIPITTLYDAMHNKDSDIVSGLRGTYVPYICCGKKMMNVPMQSMLDDIDGEQWVCLECGTYYNEINGQFDEEELEDFKHNYGGCENER